MAVLLVPPVTVVVEVVVSVVFSPAWALGPMATEWVPLAAASGSYVVVPSVVVDLGLTLKYLFSFEV